MAGIYFHIPFCKQACHYCDFHFSTSLKYKDEMVGALGKELELRSGYLQEQHVESIYFGGGTPSILSADKIRFLLDAVSKRYQVDQDIEITLEANPDDLTAQKVNALRSSGINRFSIGIQSFFDEDLKWMNRVHNEAEADSAVKRVQDAGFTNITIDLIYGFPLLSDQKWKSNIRKATALCVPHISAYSMTVEPKTALASFIRTGKQRPMDERQSAAQFLTLTERLAEEGYEQYEISNYSLPGRYAKHNSNYWRGIPYLGIGPSAHSFNGTHRHWNVSNNHQYLSAIRKGTPEMESEALSGVDRLNEYTMTALRTKWGMDLNFVEEKFGTTAKERIEKAIPPFLDSQKLLQRENVITLSPEGMLLADRIASELFLNQGDI